MNEYIFSMDSGRRISIQLPYTPEELATMLNEAWTSNFVIIGHEIMNVEKITCVEFDGDGDV